MTRKFPCEGSGQRVSPTGSSAFPEVKCPKCHYWASPVAKYGEHQIRSHRPVKHEVFPEIATEREPLTSSRL